MVFIYFFLFSILTSNINSNDIILLPINSYTRKSTSEIKLTEIGQFGVIRKARSAVPVHYHTGIDIKRPWPNYDNEPIFPIAKGYVISKRDDGPFAQLIIEHHTNNYTFWSVYEHIAGIQVKVGDEIDPNLPIGRFMNEGELNRYGWQFDHLHFEILKIKPIKLTFNSNNPERFYGSYTLICYSYQDLNKYFYNPIIFFDQYFTKK